MQKTVILEKDGTRGACHIEICYKPQSLVGVFRKCDTGATLESLKPFLPQKAEFAGLMLYCGGS
jgi:hypothetical protein